MEMCILYVNMQLYICIRVNVHMYLWMCRYLYVEKYLWDFQFKYSVLSHPMASRVHSQSASYALDVRMDFLVLSVIVYNFLECHLSG